MILGYCRVSSDSQAGPDKSSLDSQEQTIHGYAMMKGMSKFDVQIFTDAGVSGATKFAMRPGGEKLLQAVQPGDTVIASKLDRMFRSTADALAVAEDFKDRGIHLVLLDINSEPITSGGIAQFIFTILAAVASMERERIKERVSEGRRAKKAKQGAIGHAPFGFRKEGERSAAKLVVDEKEQEVIRFVHARKDTLPLRGIAKELTAAGYMSRAGKPFAAESISNILEQSAA